MLRVAIAGAGMASQYHLRAWNKVSGASVVAIADPDLGRAQIRATEFDIESVFDIAETMLDTVRPDALDVAAGHAAHHRLCLAAAMRGIPILCQKPLAPTLGEASAIVDIVGHRVRLMIHENWRFRPWYVQARAWMESDAIGTPQQIHLAARSSGFLLREGVRPALQRQPMLARVPRLMLGEVLVHHLDVACHLMGSMTVSTASTRHDIVEVSGETAAEVILEGNGTSAVVSGDLADASAPTAVTDTMRVKGSAGTITLQGTLLALEGRFNDAVTFNLEAGYQQSYDDAIGHFAHALTNNTPFATPPRAHLNVLAMVEDAYRLANRVAPSQ